MWKKVKGKNGLVHTADPSRVKFRTNISKRILEDLETLAIQHDSHVNYLLENGLENVLSEGVILFDKETRPIDRIQYKTSYDEELLNQVKEFAKNHKLFINDVIEYSVKYINLQTVKKSSYKNRIEWE